MALQFGFGLYANANEKEPWKRKFEALNDDDKHFCFKLM
jgi:hypothetical protein